MPTSDSWLDHRERGHVLHVGSHWKTSREAFRRRVGTAIVLVSLWCLYIVSDRYNTLLDDYIASSYGDLSFTIYVLIPICQKMDPVYRKKFWGPEKQVWSVVRIHHLDVSGCTIHKDEHTGEPRSSEFVKQACQLGEGSIVLYLQPLWTYGKHEIFYIPVSWLFSSWEEFDGFFLYLLEEVSCPTFSGARSRRMRSRCYWLLLLQLCYPVELHLEPAETSTVLLSQYFRLLANNALSADKRPLMNLLAIHHLNRFLRSVDSDEADAKFRGRFLKYISENMQVGPKLMERSACMFGERGSVFWWPFVKSFGKGLVRNAPSRQKQCVEAVKYISLARSATEDFGCVSDWYGATNFAIQRTGYWSIDVYRCLQRYSRIIEEYCLSGYVVGAYWQQPFGFSPLCLSFRIFFGGSFMFETWKALCGYEFQPYEYCFLYMLAIVNCLVFYTRLLIYREWSHKHKQRFGCNSLVLSWNRELR